MAVLDDLVITTLAAACNIERAQLSPETGLDEIGLDSMSLVALVAQLEALYGCQFESEQVLGLFEARRIRDVVLLVGRVVGMGCLVEPA